MPSSAFATLTKYARRLNHMNGAGHLPALIFITDRARLPDPLAVIKKLGPDSAVIFRDYDAPDRKDLGQALACACRERSIRFLVAGDEALAQALTADGLHLPEHRLSESAAMRRKHPDWLITVAAHGAAALTAAHAAGADAALLSPVFATASHPETLKSDKGLLGARGFANLSDASPLPVYALGGVTAENIALIKGGHTAGVAAIGAFDEA